jgi:hypothetical protein
MNILAWGFQAVLAFCYLLYSIVLVIRHARAEPCSFVPLSA